MIRNAILHLLGEQPLFMDLAAEPNPTDLVLVCTNLRTSAGKRPHFVDDGDATFLFPYAQIRFIEIPAGGRALAGSAAAAGAEAPPAAPEEEVLQLDEDFLRRVREV